MSPELDKALFKKYPKLYRGESSPPTENLMCFGFECGPGWFKIIDELSQYIENYNDTCENVEDYCVALQVKEKFGGLRFYVAGGNEQIFERIFNAESESMKTCENCGKPGKLRGNRWLYVSCEEHKQDED